MTIYVVNGATEPIGAFTRSLWPALPVETDVPLESAMDEQSQVDWVEFRRGSATERVLRQHASSQRADA